MFKFFTKQEKRTGLPQLLKVDPDDRIYAVGDIHGRYDLVSRLVDWIVRDVAQFSDGKRSKLIFLGDYVDRGDDSRAVLEYVQSLTQTPPLEEVHILLGNHEEAMLDFMDNPISGAAWLEFGGLQTLASFGVRPPMDNTELELERAASEFSHVAETHRNFLRRCPMILQSGNVVFVHAGIDPTIPLSAQTPQVMLWGRSDFLKLGGVAGLLVVHGHYAEDKAITTPMRIGIDTGAYYSGCLTGVRLDDDIRLFSTLTI